MKYQTAICFIIVIILLYPGCITINNNTNHGLYNYEYSIIIRSNNSNYFLYLPLIIDINDNVIPLMNNLSFINGNGNYSMVDCKYGKCLNISGNGNIQIEGTMPGYMPTSFNTSRFPDGTPGLSMLEESTDIQDSHIIGKVWIYCNTSNEITISLSFNRGSGAIGLFHKINNARLMKGWQQLDVEAEYIVI